MTESDLSTSSAELSSDRKLTRPPRAAAAPKWFDNEVCNVAILLVWCTNAWVAAFCWVHCARDGCTPTGLTLCTSRASWSWTSLLLGLCASLHCQSSLRSQSSAVIDPVSVDRLRRSWYVGHCRRMRTSRRCTRTTASRLCSLCSVKKPVRIVLRIQSIPSHSRVRTRCCSAHLHYLP